MYLLMKVMVMEFIQYIIFGLAITKNIMKEHIKEYRMLFQILEELIKL